MASLDRQRRELGGTLDVRYEEAAPDIHAVAVLNARHTQALDYDGAGNLLYEGRAAVGSSKAAAVWQIKKFLYSGTAITDIQWATGDTDYDHVWNDRAGLAYS